MSDTALGQADDTPVMPDAAAGYTGKRLRILCLGRFCDEVPGGIQTHVQHLFTSLRSRVFFLNVVPARRAVTSFFRRIGMPVLSCAGYNLDKSVSLSWVMVWKLFWLHRKKPFDVVHLHFPDPMSHLASWFIPRRVPRVITYHADIVRQKFLLAFYQPFMLRELKRAAAVVVATPAHVSSSPLLSANANAMRLRVVPFGFDWSPFLKADVPVRAAALRAASPWRNAVAVFALGRHVYYKGFDVLIRALACASGDAREAGAPVAADDLRPSQPDIHLVLGGDGPLTAEYRALVEQLGMTDRVHFAGRIADEDLPLFYAACDVFCLPAVATAEAFGIVQLEAMVCGKPVISTRLNNGVDYVNSDGVTGLVVEPGDVDALASALQRLALEPALRTQLGQTGRERATNVYGLQAMGNGMMALYQDVRNSDRDGI